MSDNNQNGYDGYSNFGYQPNNMSQDSYNNQYYNNNNNNYYNTNYNSPESYNTQGNGYQNQDQQMYQQNVDSTYYQNNPYQSNPYQTGNTMAYNARTTMSGADVDARVSKVVARSFLFMCAFLLISGVAAILTYQTGAIDSMSYTQYSVLLVAEVIIVLIASATMKKNLFIPSAILSIVYSIINGVTLSIIFTVFEMGSIVGIFICAAILFGVMAVFGIVTKKNLTSLGSVGYMLLIAVIIMGVSNLFIKSSGLNLIYLALGLAVFIGITAYDTQKLKVAAAASDESTENSVALFGALNIYLDLINIFLKLLALFGRRR